MSTKSLWAVIAGIAVSALVLVPSSLPASDPEAANPPYRQGSPLVTHRRVPMPLAIVVAAAVLVLSVTALPLGL